MGLVGSALARAGHFVDEYQQARRESGGDVLVTDPHRPASERRAVLKELARAVGREAGAAGVAVGQGTRVEGRGSENERLRSQGDISLSLKPFTSLDPRPSTLRSLRVSRRHVLPHEHHRRRWSGVSTSRIACSKPLLRLPHGFHLILHRRENRADFLGASAGCFGLARFLMRFLDRREFVSDRFVERLLSARICAICCFRQARRPAAVADLRLVRLDPRALLRRVDRPDRFLQCREIIGEPVDGSPLLLPAMPGSPRASRLSDAAGGSAARCCGARRLRPHFLHERLVQRGDRGLLLRREPQLVRQARCADAGAVHYRGAADRIVRHQARLVDVGRSSKSLGATVSLEHAARPMSPNAATARNVFRIIVITIARVGSLVAVARRVREK